MYDNQKKNGDVGGMQLQKFKSIWFIPRSRDYVILIKNNFIKNNLRVCDDMIFNHRNKVYDNIVSKKLKN